MRVAIQQGTTILAAFVTEQLELDLKRNQQVNEGEITQLEADLQAEIWEKVRRCCKSVVALRCEFFVRMHFCMYVWKKGRPKRRNNNSSPPTKYIYI